MELPNEEWIVSNWKEVAYDKADILDPDNSHDWRSLALGFALGAGYTIELAEQFVNIVSSKRLI
ncbi:hypothetical protein KAR91_46900 [Candidatus Pacearchaeota archaeon]|nr:hypothetical protein [Candidatus Pacearchaeota archaeon]